MPDAGRWRYRITFGKTEAMRFTGHLDLHRTWERTFRRAGLPLAYSEGYNPQPKINIGAALPLGCVSEGDLIDAWLETEVDTSEVASALRQAAPPGIRVEGVLRVPPTEPALQRQIERAIFEVTSDGFPEPSEMNRRIAAILNADRLPRSRRGKSYDLRPLVEEIRFDRARSCLWMRLAARPGATGRPEEALDALGLDASAFLIRRTQLLLATPQEAPSQP